MKSSWLITGLLLVGAISLIAETGPRWWTNPVTAIYEPGTTLRNYSPANVGQLKYVARRAKHYLDRNLWAQGGAGPAITAMVLNFEPRSNQGYTSAQIAAFKQANLVPVNLGQAKLAAKPFYDRLLAVGYGTRANLIYNGYSGAWAFDYPWNPSTPLSENYRPLNIGQLKLIFSFAFDTDHNGLEDYWEQQFLGGLGQNPAADPDSDGLTNAQECDLWTDPLTWNDISNLDSNGDGILDYFAGEVGYSTYDLDLDNDGLLNTAEYLIGTNPFWFDTDGDGVADGIDQFPLDGTQSQFPPAGGDTVAPLITLLTPENATLIP